MTTGWITPNFLQYAGAISRLRRNASTSAKQLSSWSNTSHRDHQRVLLHNLIATPVLLFQATLAAGLWGNNPIHHWLKSSSRGVSKWRPTLWSEWEAQITSKSLGNMMLLMLRRAAPLTAAPSRMAATSFLAGIWKATEMHWISSPASCSPFRLRVTTCSLINHCWRLHSLLTNRATMAMASPRCVLPSNTMDKALVEASSVCNLLSSSSSIKGV